MDDDYFDDGYGFNDADEENLLDESHDEDEFCESDQDDWEEEEKSWSQDEEVSSRLDEIDELILGTMIAGNAVDEARLNRLKNKFRK